MWTTIDRTNRHGFTVYKTSNGEIHVGITQFTNDEFGDLCITSSFYAHLHRSEAEELINVLQEKLA